jgi:hypothetical protein
VQELGLKLELELEKAREAREIMCEMLLQLAAADDRNPCNDRLMLEVPEKIVSAVGTMYQ